jgi:outer membrane receptor protein involved in Fe transport
VSPEYSLPVRASSLQAVFQANAWRLAAFRSYSRTPNTPAYTPENAAYNDIAFQANDLFIGTASYGRDIGGVDTNTTLTFSRHELDPESGYLNVYSGMQRSYKYAYGSSIRAEHQAKWHPVSRLSLMAGGEIAHSRSLPQTADLQEPIARRGDVGIILGTTMPDELFDIRYWNAGLFVNGQWSLTPRAKLTMGVRADSNSRYDTVLNPRVGLVWTIAPTTTLKVLYGTAYLAPSPYQMYLRYGSFYSVDNGQTYQSDFWHVPNPELKPQRKRTAEVVIDHSFGGVVSVGGSAFYSRFTDLVQEADVTTRQSGLYRGWPVALIQQSFNTGRETTFGGTLQADYMRLNTLGRLRVRGAVSLATGDVADAAAPGGSIESGGMTPLLFQVIGDFDRGAWSLSPRLVAVGPQRALAIATASDGSWHRQTIDGHVVVNLSARRRFARVPVDVFVTAENLLDARYRNVNLRAFTNAEEIIGSVQNPRRLSVGLDVRIR